ncbi:hypothetical protein NLO83_17670 [Pseudomonas tremae]|uniref:hypothetical protein n=1 Tax=Pseudomonas syringae group TaxID=136849 RepID=UPI0002E14C88|nr:MULTISPECIES: hypothetical protein [Pseudomonas syringae group]MCQ3017412.1 hypothetical protein [Pseudomonas tremae]QGL59384.1 hypothetical protein POR16_25160 [Pseudomonas coronafaciens pv. oryzae str. 1_6]
MTNLDDFMNPTANQHFISQSEQRLNSCSDPSAKKPEIYRFSIVDRKTPTMQLKGKIPIWKNLGFQDLFTLMRTTDNSRLNFEHLFERYEGPYPQHVSSLLAMINDVRNSLYGQSPIHLRDVKGFDFERFLDHVKFIYTYKTMNWLRNPHKIKEVLKQFDTFLDHVLDKPGAMALYVALAEKNPAEENYICKTYDVSSKEYKQWIRLLLLFLYIDKDEDSSVLDSFIHEFFIAPEFATTIFVAVFDEHCALLTDTGVVKDSGNGPLTYMNVAKNCIIALEHARLDVTLDKLIKGKAIDKPLIEELRARIATDVNAVLMVNDYDILHGYNQICVRATAKEVFCAAPDVHGVHVLPPEQDRT